MSHESTLTYRSLP